MTDAGFRDEYQRATDDVLACLDRSAQEQLARTSPGLHPDTFSMRAYLEASGARFEHAMDLVERHAPGARSFLDIGAWMGSFSLALARLGHEAVAVDAYSYVGGALDGVRELLRRDGVKVIDRDLTSSEHDLGQFDVVTNMAMIEHLPDSPRPLLRNLHRACRRLLVLDTPNLGYGYRRWGLLRGRSPLPPVRQLYEGDPFTGHHREYTAAEIRELLSLAGFQSLELRTFNYSLTRDVRNWRQIGYWLAMTLPACREVLITAARPRDD
jgi:2-polyprenyl-3-methyl-5-hydroxy-6-metoxy-1,4-benzoquinol methylase